MQTSVMNNASRRGETPFDIDGVGFEPDGGMNEQAKGEGGEAELVLDGIWRTLAQA